jgi:ribonuclease HII
MTSVMEEHWLELRKYEKTCWDEGYEYIAGCDEVGAGSLAGPVVSSSVILPRDFKILGLRDSKAATQLMRELWVDQIKEQAIAWAIGQIEPADIDKVNIRRASLLSMELAVQKLTVQPNYVLIDGRSSLPNLKGIPQKPIVKGDTLSAAIACASVVAKVYRDSLMLEYDKQYPEYGFRNHKGYGTKEHMEAVRKYGPCPLHRKTFLKFLSKWNQMSIFDLEIIS